MSVPRLASAAPAGAAARRIDAALRLSADPRVALGLLLVAAAANALAAATPGGPQALDSVPYAVLLAAIVVSGTLAVAARLPAAWREWRHPSALPEGAGGSVAELPLEPSAGIDLADRVVTALRAAGYRVAVTGSGSRRAVHGTRHGWSRIAALVSHLAMVVVLVGAATSAAFGSETTFSLLPGEQALLAPPAPGHTDAVRLEAFEAEFGPDGRPRRLDSRVTFLRDGRPVEAQTIQVNRPGAFGGFLVHGWTYGPAVELRVASIAGRALHDGPLPLDDARAGRPASVIDVPAAGVSIGLVLVDAVANELGVTVAGSGGIVDATTLRPGASERVGDVVVTLHRFSSYVTFLSRSDPGLIPLFAGAGALTLSLAAAFWLPRRRVSVAFGADGVRIRLRGERFDSPAAELDRLRSRLAEALG